MSSSVNPSASSRSRTLPPARAGDRDDELPQLAVVRPVIPGGLGPEQPVRGRRLQRPAGLADRRPGPTAPPAGPGRRRCSPAGRAGPGGRRCRRRRRRSRPAACRAGPSPAVRCGGGGTGPSNRARGPARAAADAEDDDAVGFLPQPWAVREHPAEVARVPLRRCRSSSLLRQVDEAGFQRLQLRRRVEQLALGGDLAADRCSCGSSASQPVRRKQVAGPAVRPAASRPPAAGPACPGTGTRSFRRAVAWRLPNASPKRREP